MTISALSGIQHHSIWCWPPSTEPWWRGALADPDIRWGGNLICFLLSHAYFFVSERFIAKLDEGAMYAMDPWIRHWRGATASYGLVQGPDPVRLGVSDTHPPRNSPSAQFSRLLCPTWKEVRTWEARLFLLPDGAVAAVVHARHSQGA